jgi:hypothetical protein
MNDEAAPCPHGITLRSLAAVEPYETYRAAREKGVVHWDSSLGGWLVLGFDECSAVL